MGRCRAAKEELSQKQFKIRSKLFKNKCRENMETRSERERERTTEKKRERERDG